MQANHQKARFSPNLRSWIGNHIGLKILANPKEERVHQHRQHRLLKHRRR
jgi:hypothetical protein